MKILHGFLVVLFLFSFWAAPIPVAGQTGIPAGATIDSAVLSLYVTQASPVEVDVHRITKAWTENGITWNGFAGAYDDAVVDSALVDSTGWKTFDVKTLVEAWVAGTNPNDGLLLSVLMPSNNDAALFDSSEASNVALRPKLEVCYTVANVGQNCLTFQRAGSPQGGVADAFIASNAPDTNNGSSNTLAVGHQYATGKANIVKQALVRFEIPVLRPAVSIVKYTNDQEAKDPNGTDVPNVVPGGPVVWTYKVTNTGNVPVARADVVVTDDQLGVTPAFDHEVSGNGDMVFDPAEVWMYSATGVGIDLYNPPGDVKVVPNACTQQGKLPPRIAYVNTGTVTIPGATASAKSSYCGPELEQWPFFYYIPLLNNGGKEGFFQVTVGYEDLPLDGSIKNDFDYNDWVVDIRGSGSITGQDPVTNVDLWRFMKFNIVPNGRGATFDHAFHIHFPAGTFKDSGTWSLILRDPNSAVVSTSSGPYDATTDVAIVIFEHTKQVFPQNYANTYEVNPIVSPQLTAELTIEFSQSTPFDPAQFDFSKPHGQGLFFDPHLHVYNTGESIERNDLRLLTVPDLTEDPYLWPEERVAIDRAYPLVDGTAPNFNFAPGWWKVKNHCVMDHVPCDN